jgi:hypothetical protein
MGEAKALGADIVPWKFMQNDSYSPLELYNLAADPHERNVIDQHPEIAGKLRATLAHHILRDGAVPWQPPGSPTDEQ